MQPQRNSLTLLVNPPAPIEFGSYRIEVTPIIVKELPLILQRIGHLLSKLDLLRGPEDVAALLADHGADIVEAAAIAARLPLEQVESLLPDELAELVFGLVEVNVDFFVPRLPRLNARAGALGERLKARTPSAAPSTGPMPSPA